MPLIDMSEIFQMTNVGDHIDGTDVYQSNRNLLDNAYFVGGGSQLGDGHFPINQRGQTSYATAGNTIDRWVTYGALTVNSDSITITNNTSGGLWFAQRTTTLPNATLTGSAIVTAVSGNVEFVVQELGSPWQTAFTKSVTAAGLITGTGVKTNSTTYQAGFVLGAGASVTVKAIKVEKGTVSTLLNDVPPDFGEELRKCQRRLFIHDFANGDIIASGFAVSASYSVCSLVLPVSMASDGTLTGTVTANPLIYGGGTGEQVSSFSVSAVKGNYAKIGVATTVMPANNSITLYANTNIRLTISKEL